MSNSNMTYHEMKQAILQGLLHSGWKAVDEISMNHTSAVAKKSFQTAVGERTALAYFRTLPTNAASSVGNTPVRTITSSVQQGSLSGTASILGAK
ncbi:hypothetical protein [Pseudomonas sp. G5(2012)]|uniref:hypothetical protein n=1 Tax=Pseudomonas sp. G5(2012) TaxID=1268068 RepID=UPI0005B41CE3|nr:hypothetical protein [Pseudomonas sp. G5(2012)]